MATMIRSPAYERTLEITSELTKLVRACEETGVFDGHDQMFVRQLSLLLYLTCKPKTERVIEDMRQLAVGMNNDYVMLMARLHGNQGLG